LENLEVLVTKNNVVTWEKSFKKYIFDRLDSLDTQINILTYKENFVLIQNDFKEDLSMLNWLSGILTCEYYVTWKNSFENMFGEI
jgi:hypothetical protein